MTIAAAIRPEARGGVRRRLAGPLLIASHEEHSVAGALRVAEALARRDGVHAHVLGSVRGFVSTGSELGQADAAAATAARERGAEYILMGVPPAGSRARLDRLAAATRLADEARAPVLVVPAETELLPRRALVAMDSDEASMSAAAAALALLGADGSLTLGSAEPGEIRALQGFAVTLGVLGGLDVRAAVLPPVLSMPPDFFGGFDLVAVPTANADPAILASAVGSVLIVPPAETDDGGSA